MNAALNACGRTGRIKEALELMRDARASGIELDVVSYNGAIPACVESGDWEQALSMLREMDAEYGIKPNHITYQAAIKVIIHPALSPPPPREQVVFVCVVRVPVWLLFLLFVLFCFGSV